jgi:hypothetical protein
MVAMAPAMPEIPVMLGMPMTHQARVIEVPEAAMIGMAGTGRVHSLN